MSLIYKQMSLFDAPEGSILVHACNAEGIWGSGIAAEMKERYPEQYEFYKVHAHNLGSSVFDGISQEKHNICNLITSSLDSKHPDSIEDILINTATSLSDFLDHYREFDGETKIYSNKFNSGIFNVPWEKTEFILKLLINRYKVKWTVCEYSIDKLEKKE